MMTNEQEAAAWDKASELAAAATRCRGTGVAPYIKIRQACIDVSKWQYEQDKLELAAKDAQIQALQDKLDRANDALKQIVESKKEYYDV